MIIIYPCCNKINAEVDQKKIICFKKRVAVDMLSGLKSHNKADNFSEFIKHKYLNILKCQNFQ